MPSDGPIIYIDNRPFTPIERVVRFKPEAGVARSGGERCRAKIIDRVTISSVARKMYRITYGKGRPCSAVHPPTYTRYVAANPVQTIPYGTGNSTTSND